MSFIRESRLAYKKVQEAEDYEISMARGELEAIADKATKLASMLQGKSDEGNPLEAWVQSKITKAKDYINSVSDYMMYDPSVNESYDLEETTFEKIYQMQQDGKSAEDIAKELKLKPDLVKKVLGEEVILENLTDAQIALLKKEYDPLKGKTITSAQFQQLKNILGKLHDGDLEKLQKQNIPFASTGAGSILRVRKSPVKITNVTVPGLEGMAEESDKGFNVKYKMKKDDASINMSWYKDKELAQKFLDDVKKAGGNGIITAKEKEVKESKASDEAKKKDLEYYGFGRYGKDKTVTHKSIDGNLKELPKDQQTKVDDKDIKKEPENKSKDNQPKVDDKEKLTKKPIDHKDTIKTIKGLDIDDLNIEDDEKNIFFTKEFDYEMDDFEDAKATYMDIVKSLNKQGINYRPNPKQDIEVDKDNEYMQINFSVKKEAVDNPYAIGMAAAMKATGDTPPLKKSTIVKAHKIADKVKKEEVEITETHFSMGQHVIFKGPKNPITPIKAQIIKLEPPYTGAYYQIKKADGETTYASPDQLELDEDCWTGYKKVGLKKKGNRMVPNCVPEETIKEQKRLYIESIVAVKNKAEKSGMPYSVLKQVYDRGMAAWKGGHRPGTTQVQWALARVNSFITKSSGTWGGADSDLAKKVKG